MSPVPPFPAPDSAARRLVDFMAFAEGLKRELRHSWLSDGRRESVAEHSWAMALMALIAAPHLERPVDLAKALKMILVHDLVEAAAGDVPVFEIGERKARKTERERAAIEEIRARLGAPVGEEIHALWHEFEDRRTDEARLRRRARQSRSPAAAQPRPIGTWERRGRPVLDQDGTAPLRPRPVLAAVGRGSFNGRLRRPSLRAAVHRVDAARPGWAWRPEGDG